MKNFDIENLDRKTPYTMPDTFFAEMQKNVLEQTVNKKTEAKVISFNFKWAAAAAVTLIAGLTAFFMNPDSQKDAIIAQKDQIIDSTYKPQSSTIATTTVKPKLDINPTKDNTIVTKSNNQPRDIIKNKTKPITVASNINTSSKTYAKANPEVRLSQSLAAFTSDEISEIERSIEQDVYLDLYN